MWAVGIGIILLYNLLIFYIGYNIWVWLKHISGDRKSIKIIFWVALIIFAYSFVFSRWLDESLFFTWLGAIWLSLFYFLILLLPVANIAVFIRRFTKLPKEKFIKWTGYSILVMIVCAFSFGVYNAYSPKAKLYQINIPKQVEGKQSLKIIMASDMHFGDLSGSGQAKKLVEYINFQKPDLVLFPGDIIDDDITPFLEEGIPDILKKIQAPVYASLGNHDRDDVDLVKIFNNSGMKVLDDEVLNLPEGIVLVGRKDKGYQDVVRAELSALMKQVDSMKPVFLLEHQPYDLDIAEKNGVDLILSGHTHRGQVAPGNLITNMIFENDWGYLKKGELQSIVSSGYGVWGLPLRIGTRSEIIQINVTFDPLKKI
ncbi:metallophosphoesterase [Neobacillus niacini]|uniref:metallophosphoesterase n=1 Tax=Neobacillus niacini TaxID=86668 RepID=UPI0005F015F9|nr:metallophosphoesterase [Neobacillus niacini]